MKILSIDIGGTYSRFGDFTASQGTLKQNGESFKVLTTDEAFDSLEALVAFFNHDKPAPFAHPGHYDLIVLGVAGPVIHNRCRPPNIAWDIDLNTFPYRDQTLMVNDFVAQAYGLIYPEIRSRLLKVRGQRESSPEGNIAVIGPGTGLGHCCLVLQDDAASSRFLHVPSEAGNAAFAFHGQVEKELEQYILSKKGIEFCANDDVVSGSGLALIHEFLTNEPIDPTKIDEKEDRFKETFGLFSRLFGRACKNYCLAMLAAHSLIITGGVAIHNPGVVAGAEFYDEFVNSRHEHLLSNISIYLNPGIETGLLGNAFYGMIKKHSPR